MLYESSSLTKQLDGSWAICISTISEWQIDSSLYGFIRFNNEYLLELFQRIDLGLCPFLIDENNTFIINWPGWGCHCFLGSNDTARIRESGNISVPKSLMELYQCIVDLCESLLRWQESTAYIKDIETLDKWEKTALPINTPLWKQLLKIVYKDRQIIINKFDRVKIQYQEHVETCHGFSFYSKDYEYRASYEMGGTWVVEKEETSEEDSIWKHQ